MHRKVVVTHVLDSVVSEGRPQCGTDRREEPASWSIASIQVPQQHEQRCVQGAQQPEYARVLQGIHVLQGAQREDEERSQADDHIGAVGDARTQSQRCEYLREGVPCMHTSHMYTEQQAQSQWMELCLQPANNNTT